MRKLALHWQIIIGLGFGVVWALLASELGWTQFTIDWIDPFGTIFLRLLKFIAVPLVLFSIIAGIAGLSEINKLGRMGAKTLLAYLTTTVVAVSLGLLLVNTFQPGKTVDESQRAKNRISYELWVAETPGVEILDGKSYLTDEKYSSLVDSVRQSSDMKVPTAKDLDMEELQQTAAAQKDKSPLSFIVEMVPENIFGSLSSNSMMLQIIFFGIFFGITLKFIPEEQAKPVVAFVNGANEVFLKMVDIVMKAAPFFVFALMAGVMVKMGDSTMEILQIFKGLGFYSLAVAGGLAFLVFVFYPVLLSLLVKKLGYRQFLRNISPAQFLAFSTSSSAATLPVTMDCVEERLGVSRNVTSFVLPIGATVNMDGTSLYQAIAVIFLAQIHEVDLNLVQQLTIVLTATLASIGSAAVPSAGLIMLIIVLQSVGLNPAWIAIIFPVDRILDMCRTVVNVTGDATVSTVIANSEGELHPPVESD
ncbi:dicarboxylate/amino acid:cation symporter [Halocola ammonii]